MIERNWIDMDAPTQQARNEKARQIRLCRDYLSGAKEQGLSEKSITVRKWRMLLAEWRAEPVEVIVVSSLGVDATSVETSEIVNATFSYDKAVGGFVLLPLM